MTASFAAGALLLSLILALLTHGLAANYLVRQREAASLRQADVNARLVQLALRPLSDAAEAAAAIAGGRLDTRLPPDEDASLAGLAKSFNAMADALQRRIQRDARFASDVSHELRSPLTTLAAATEVLAGRREEFGERARRARRPAQRRGGPLPGSGRGPAGDLKGRRWDDGAGPGGGAPGRAGRALRPGGQGQAAGGRVAGGSGRQGQGGQAPFRAGGGQPGQQRHHPWRRGRAGRRRAGRRPPERVRLVVEDGGPGVPLAERERVFERFSRAGGGGGRSGGAGLGLALVREHVRVHGGAAWVEDRTGGGARFVVELPRVDQTVDQRIGQ